MKLQDILKVGIREGIAADPRGIEELKLILAERKKHYDKLDGVQKEIYDTDRLENPYEDSKIIWDPDQNVQAMCVGIDIDTSELLLINKLAQDSSRSIMALGHHPLGRAYSNFYEVMDMQADILASQGVTPSIADALTASRKGEVARKVSASNHFKAAAAARLLNVPTMNLHTPADNHVATFLQTEIDKNKPRTIKDLLDYLLSIPEYLQSAKNGQPPHMITGSKSNKCGKVFVDMTGGTEGNAQLLEKLVSAGVSTVVGMHMSEKHYETAKKENLNVIIAGHISSDNVGLNLLLDKIIAELGDIEIIELSGFYRYQRKS